MKVHKRTLCKFILFFCILIGAICFAPEKKTEAATSTYTCTVVFISNEGESVPTQVLKQGTYLSTLPTPTREGYTFSGWYTNESMTLKISTPYYMTVSNQDTVLVLYAKWTKIAVKSIVATYSEKTATINSELDRSKLTVTALYSNGTTMKVTDYTLSSVAVSSIGINIYTVTYDGCVTTFYVVGIAEQYYTVTFVSNGGSNVDKITGVKSGDTIILPEEPYRAGYTFKGWYQDASYKLKFTTTTKITYNMYAFAKWEKDEIEDETETYTLNKTAMALKLHATDNLFIESFNPDLENYVEFESNKPSVASVDSDGLVTAEGYGTAVIYVTAPDGSLLKCKVTVSTNTPAKKIDTNVSAKRIKIGAKFKIKTTLYPSNVTVTKVKYGSTNKSIAKVSSSGTVTGKKAGTCYILVKTTDGSGLSKKVKVRVI